MEDVMPVGIPQPSDDMISDPSGEIRTAVSDGLVGLLKEFYGRGPDRTKTYVTGDLVVCLPRESSTT